ncbi:V-type ATP synthase subunit D [Methanosarcina horonobensis]|uniref:V-type ATP synthase subunit D n=1 Tax=Methanosarcina horonobensis TaxID=418008 RepID=UPI0022B8D10B|nr:V-type ATP synthase subunit D [Methanosarcina horonobensis]
MAQQDVKPTRSELINLKKKIKLSESGHKLLKMKRDGLILEFFKILNEARNVRTELDAAFAKSTEKNQSSLCCEWNGCSQINCLYSEGIP